MSSVQEMTNKAIELASAGAKILRADGSQVTAIIYLPNTQGNGNIWPEVPNGIHGESIRDLADALLLRSDGWFLMLAFYGDDSGNHGKGPFVVAGYLGLTSDWFYMERDWEKVLEEPPAIDYFKMGECYHLEGQFEKISKPERDEKLHKLVDVVCRYNERLTEVSSMVTWEDYRSAIGDGAFKEEFYNPYFFCLHGVTSQVAKILQSEKSNEIVHYTFDHQSNLEHHSAAQYYLIRTQAPKEFTRHMGGISHEDDKQFKPLQIADLIAWHVRRDFAKPKQDAGKQRPELTKLRQGIHKAECALLRPSSLAQTAIDIDEQVRSTAAAAALARITEDDEELP